MQVELSLNNSSSPTARYLTWSPTPLRLRLTDVPPLPAPPIGAALAVTLRAERSGPTSGDLLFRATGPGAPKPAATLKVSLPRNGSSVNVLVHGRFGSPSTADQDVRIVAEAPTFGLLGALPVMVRVRKNANRLSVPERDRFIAALAQLNDRGTGRFADFRNMHVAAAQDEAHFDAAFLPWHRAYLLDLERELQALDPSVTLPYWRFDQPAPNLFTPDFLGATGATGNAEFSPSNPLQFWATDGVQGILRRARPGFDPLTAAAVNVISESATLALGNRYAAFRTLEENPHGNAHVFSFSGSISAIQTAAKDHLFFLLHCNVDLLWAKWQQQIGRYNPATASAYDSGPTPTSRRVGHNLGDSMWPWNGVTTPPRPSTAPGGALARSPVVSAPGLQPLVRHMLDFQGSVDASAQLGFAYDDVRFL